MTELTLADAQRLLTLVVELFSKTFKGPVSDMMYDLRGHAEELVKEVLWQEYQADLKAEADRNAGR